MRDINPLFSKHINPVLFILGIGFDLFMNTSHENIKASASRKKIVKRLSQLMALSFIMEIILCWRLWLPVNREFPMVSAFSWLDFSIGVVGDGLISMILLIALIFILLDKRRNLAIRITIACFLILILEDINRFQPWVYSQGSILILISFYEKGKEKTIQSGAILVIAFVYIWSGIQKLNLNFLKETFPWILSTFGFDFQIEPNQTLGTPNYLMILIPVIESFIGLFLLNSKTRKIGVFMGLLMHLFIILSLGPTGHNWNHIVLPWNLSLMLFLILILFQEKHIKIIEGIKSSKLNLFLLLLFGLMPALNFVDYWDNSLSGGMYSGTHTNVAFYFDSNSEVKLPKHREASTTLVIYKTANYSISRNWLGSWSVNELNVPFYQADRYYKRYGKKLCQEFKPSLLSGIEITKRSKFTGKQSIIKYSCNDLLK